VTFAVQVPQFDPISTLNSRTINSMTFAVQKPLFASRCSSSFRYHLLDPSAYSCGASGSVTKRLTSSDFRQHQISTKGSRTTSEFRA
jgi:hypothetical protein